ncbi:MULTISPECIES: TlpA disulfide reductase family protein [unclassified Streptomyces]|uniref:TlpA disulfide reductase family protein n=1 Tax=unclassified Streptomyces TaxID=2593676 RepID=UPI001660F260|nr:MULTISPECIES: TlpA disulfide reductase family protein [unclassified Streptomyces]MBD0709455.1 redoxin domain-containing protein [Streptomyces sp. CBMA291]MBD0713165.1 redoxin domain-containing protein [Streptomyces sp. CBMA370]
MSPRRAGRRALLVTGTLSAVLVLAACDSGGGAESAGDVTNFVTSRESGIATVPENRRVAAGKLAGETLHGERWDVADLKGKVVVLNVWGSWCPPCRAEAPHFAKVARELKPNGVEFVGIDTRDFDRQPAVAFEEEAGISYPSLYDPYGKLILHGFPKGTLLPNGIPSTVVLDREGRIAARALQALDEEKLRFLVDLVAAEK